MLLPIPRIIAYVSAFTPLAPGDVMASGIGTLASQIVEEREAR